MNKIKLYFGNALVVEHREPSHAAIVCRVTSIIDGVTVTGEGDMVYKLPDDKMIIVKVSYVDSKGREAEVDGDVVWATSDDMIANVGVKEGDSKQAQIIPGANLGQAQITATADADIGEGVQELICTMDIEVVGGQAVAGVITPVGEPQPFPPDQVDNTLPGDQPHVDNTLPGRSGRTPHVDNTLPGQAGRPDQGLPPTPAPKTTRR